MTIRIIAPTERYTPPPISCILWLIVFTSLRSVFFSADFIFDLSIEFISFNLNSKALTSADSTGFGAGTDEGSVLVVAFN